MKERLQAETATPKQHTTRRSAPGARRASSGSVARGLTALALLGLVVLIMSACGQEGSGSAESTSSTGSASTTTTTSAPSVPRTPEQARTQALARLDQLGPIKLTATLYGPDQLEIEARVTSLLDPIRHLALEKVTPTSGPAEQTSVVGAQTLSITGSGETATISQTKRLKPPTGLPLPLYGNYEHFLRDGRLVSGKQREDGGWELHLVSADSPTGSTSTQRAPSVGQREFLFVLGPDLLPRRMDDTTTFLTPTAQRKALRRIDYSFEKLPGLSEDQVRLAPPPGARVTENLVELPLSDPHTDVSFTQVWLGNKALGLSLANTFRHTYDPGTPQEQDTVVFLYGWDLYEEEPAQYLSVTLVKRSTGDDSGGIAADTVRLQRTVAGQEAVAFVRTNLPDGGFQIHVLLPETTVIIEGRGVSLGEPATLLDQLKPV